MRKIELLLEIFFLFLYLELQATNYFVDITNGNDTNSGTTSELPWKTINKVNLEMSTFSAGDSILFKKGETWKGTRLSIEEIDGNASSTFCLALMEREQCQLLARW